MESGQALKRIIWRYRWLLIALVLVPSILVGLYRESETPAYAAKADVQAQTSEPDAATQVQAILSRVTAVATSPQVVQNAIRSAGVHLNATKVAQHQISTAALNSSAVVTITVTDSSPSVAIRLSRALATQVVDQLNQLGSQTTQQLQQLTQQQSQLEARRNSLLKALSAAGLSSTDPTAQADITELNAVENELANNLTAQQQTRANGNQGAAVISTSPIAVGTSRHALVDAALAAILGLVVGLLIIAIREMLRPTLPDPAAGARELDVPHLGHIEVDGEAAELDEHLLARLELIANRQSASTLVLTGPIDEPELMKLARQLDDALHAERIAGISTEASVPPGFRMTGPATPHTNEPPANGNGGPRRTSNGRKTTEVVHGLRVAAFTPATARLGLHGPALVLVLPEFAPRSAVEDANELSRTTGWRVVGTIGLHRKPVRPPLALQRPPTEVRPSGPVRPNQRPRADAVSRP
jgi:capsular polysaccharide biosynthesis protein